MIIVSYGLVRAGFTFITENKTYMQTMRGMILLNVGIIIMLFFRWPLPFFSYLA